MVKGMDMEEWNGNEKKASNYKKKQRITRALFHFLDLSHVLTYDCSCAITKSNLGFFLITSTKPDRTPVSRTNVEHFVMFSYIEFLSLLGFSVYCDSTATACFKEFQGISCINMLFYFSLYIISCHTFHA